MPDKWQAIDDNGKVIAEATTMAGLQAQIGDLTKNLLRKVDVKTGKVTKEFRRRD